LKKGTNSFPFANLGNIHHLKENLNNQFGGTGKKLKDITLPISTRERPSTVKLWQREKWEREQLEPVRLENCWRRGSAVLGGAILGKNMEGKQFGGKVK